MRLSRQYGIVTEYTEFLASGGVALSKDEVFDPSQEFDDRRQGRAGWPVGRQPGCQRPAPCSSGPSPPMRPTFTATGGATS